MGAALEVRMRAFPLVALFLSGCFGLTMAPDGVDAPTGPNAPDVQDDETDEGEGTPDEGDDGDDPDDSGEDDPGDETLPATSEDLAGRLYAIDPASMRVTEPPGLDALFGEVLDRDVLVYVEGATATTIELAVALSGADGRQDPCEAVRAFPVGDWTDNPVFDVGPGELTTSFGGQPATFRSLELSGVFDPSAEAWRDGQLDATLDTRELASALGGADGCELVESLGGACGRCDDGVAACFDLRIEGIVANLADGPFDPTPDARRCED